MFTNKSQLLQENRGLVVSVARKWKNSGAEFLDLVQEGYLGMLEAMETFDPKYEVKLTTYAMYKIKKRVREYAVEYMTQKSTCDYVDFDTTPIKLPGNEKNQIDYVGTKEVLSLFSELKEKERKILLLRLEGRTLDEVGSTYGTSRQRTEQIEKCSIQKLRKRLCVKNNF